MKYAVLFISLLLTACATSTPSIYAPAPNTPSFRQVFTQPTNYLNDVVRWGGMVAETRNYATHSEVTVVQFPLMRVGSPIVTEKSQGRFIVQSDEFIDPLIFEQGALITVVGEFIDMTETTVDEATLTLPVIKLQKYHVWPEKYKERQRPYNPKHDAPFRGYGYYGTGSYSP